MTSKERHEARYQRRRAKRQQQAQKVLNKTFDDIFNFETLMKAGKKSCNGSRWKASTIQFEANLAAEVNKILYQIRNEKRYFKGFHSFTTIEHGKARNIDALHIRERTCQKALCTNLLTEAFSRSFVYDNSASLKNKGMDFALYRLKHHLQRHYRLYGTEGGILQFDFKSYFDSLPHDRIKERLREKIQDDKLYKLACCYVDDFNMRKTADKNTLFSHGVGLGSEISQIIALDYTNPIDHMIKEKYHIKGYARYMDDGYVISNSLDELRAIRKEIIKMSDELGVKVNEKKTIITPFKHHSFTFLKLQFKLIDSGKVVVKLNQKTIRSMRKKLRIFYEKHFPVENIYQSYQSWRAHAKRCDSYITLYNMDKLFISLFYNELVRLKNYSNVISC